MWDPLQKNHHSTDFKCPIVFVFCMRSYKVATLLKEKTFMECYFFVSSFESNFNWISCQMRFISSLFLCYMTGWNPNLLIGPLALAWRVLWNRVCPSSRPSEQVCFWNCIISFFLNFGMVLETHVKMCVTAG